MPTAHKTLVLDHFFFAANDEQFEELKSIFMKFECTSHQNVKADDDSWEGLYIYTRSQFYMEILKTRRQNCIGLCQKALNPLYFDARNITFDFPELPWKSFERSHQGEKWFTALSCDNYLDLTTPFNTWVMHYHQMNRDGINPRFHRKFEIQTIFEVEVKAQSSLIDRIRLNSSWFNAQKEFDDDTVIFDFQTYYSDPMRLKIDLVEDEVGIQMSKVKFKFVPGHEPKDIDQLNLKYFSLKKVYDHYELKSLAHEP